MEDLDKWALHRLHEMNEKCQKAYEAFEFHLIYHTLHNFCVLDLSSFYLDTLKDRLYVLSKNSVSRRSGQTVMNEILNVLVRLMAPVLSFTADEIWQYMKHSNSSHSVHSDLFIPVKKEFINPDLAKKWDEIIKVRKEVSKALELARKDKLIGHSLDASVILGVTEEVRQLLAPYENDLRTLFIVSSASMMPFDELIEGMEGEEIKGVKVKVALSQDVKCERCWVHDPTTGSDSSHPAICSRCVDALKGME
jgi:isoleucyl-tRNA synthetase